MTARLLAVLTLLAMIAAGCAADGTDAEEPDDDGDEAASADGADDDGDVGQISGCAPGDLETTEGGLLTIATGDPVFPPWMLDDDPEGGEGFENALVYELADRLGYAADDVTWVRETFEETIAPGPKSYDFAIQQISVTADRAEVVDFSQVYYEPDKALITLADSPLADATSFEELRDAEWGATVGTTDLDYIEEIIGADDVAVYDDQAGTFQALVAGQIDATVASFPTALFVTDVQVPESEIVASLPADPEDPGHGLLFEQGSPLVDCVDQALDALIADGVIDDLVDQYLIGDADVTEISG